MGLTGSDAKLPVGSTPLTEEDQKGLLIPSIFDREALNIAESANIAKAKAYFLVHKRKYADASYLLSDACLRDVHRRMFNEVWAWAGTYRSHDTTIGVPFETVPMRVRETLLNFRTRLDHIDESAESIDRVAIELHYELVRIHPFPNGNGRQTRQMADLLLGALGRPAFSWNESAIIRDTSVRKEYIAALEHAQEYESYGDLGPLLAFARRA